MEAFLPIIMQLIAGGVGGGGIGKFIKSADLGNIGNIITGAIGGVGGTFIAGFIPGLSGLLGSAADMTASVSEVAGATDAGGLDFAVLAGQGVSGLVGGGILTVVVGLVKNSISGK